MTTESNLPPRRICLDRLTPAELAITEAVGVVEMAGADVRLTNAVNKLHEARELVADFVDGVERPKAAAASFEIEANLTGNASKAIAKLADDADRAAAAITTLGAALCLGEKKPFVPLELSDDAFATVQRAARMLAHTRQTEALSALPPRHLVKLALACLRSGWDVTPDQLDDEQRTKILTGEWSTPVFDDAMRPAGGTPGPNVMQIVDLARIANRLRAAHLHVTSIVKPVPPLYKRAMTPLEVIDNVIDELDALEDAQP